MSRYLVAVLLLIAISAPSSAETSGGWVYAVTTAGGVDTYAGTAPDGTGFSVSVPSGTSKCSAISVACGNQAAAAAAIKAGLTITCTSCGWTATFSVSADPDGTEVASNLLSEKLALTTSGGTAFADGADTVGWPDTGGVIRTLNPAQFPGFMMAIGYFVARAKAYGNGIAGATLPPASVTIP